MSLSLPQTIKVCLLLLVMLACMAIPCESAAPAVVLDGQAFDPAGKGRANVAVTAYLVKGGKRGSVTDKNGIYKLPVPPGDVLALEFIDPLFGPVYVDSLAGMTNQNINIILGVPPQSVRGVIARYSAIERLYQQIQLTDDELPRQAKEYIRDSARKELLSLQKLEIKMPEELKKQLGEKAQHLGAQAEKFNRP